MDIINKTDTATALRILARKLDEGKDIPDFCFCVINGDDYHSAHRAINDIFGILGLVEYRKSVIICEID